MLNQYVLVGRIKKISFFENTIVVAVTRPTKEEDGAYIKDNIEISVPKKMMESIEDNCHVDDMVGVKGIIRETAMECIELIAEKITYLSATKQDEKGGE